MSSGPARCIRSTFGALDLGFYLRLTGSSFASEMTVYGELGLSLQWSFDRVWGLRYQLGVATQTNFKQSQLVSALALDMLFL